MFINPEGFKEAQERFDRYSRWLGMLTLQLNPNGACDIPLDYDSRDILTIRPVSFSVPGHQSVAGLQLERAGKDAGRIASTVGLREKKNDGRIFCAYPRLHPVGFGLEAFMNPDGFTTSYEGFNSVANLALRAKLRMQLRAGQMERLAEVITPASWPVTPDTV